MFIIYRNIDNMTHRIFLLYAIISFALLTLLIDTKLVSFKKLFNSTDHAANENEILVGKNGNLFKLNISNTRPEHAACEEREVRLSDHPLPLTGLVSFPGSGNTWVRHLLQQLTGRLNIAEIDTAGIGTSSVYCDLSLKNKGFNYECTKQRSHTIAVKTHNPDHIPTFDKIILIVRNPYEAFLAYMNFMAKGHTGVASETAIAAKTKALHVYRSIYSRLIQRATQEVTKPVYVIQYDVLKEDLEGELLGLASFLNVSVNAKDIYCTVKLQEGLHHRNSSSDQRIRNLQQIFTPQVLRDMISTVRHCQDMLEKRFQRPFDVGGKIQEVLIQSHRGNLMDAA